MSLLRNAATVSGMTLISRVLGFVRDVMIAAFLGAGPVADAFVAAFQFPNLFRRFFAEGAFNAAFVPLFAAKLEGEGERAARRFAEEALSVLLSALLVLTALCIAAMPFLVYLFVPGYAVEVARPVVNALEGLFGAASPLADAAPDPEKLPLTVTFTRILFPYLLFVSLLALYAGILNSLGRFALAAAAPVLLNVFAIAALGLAALTGAAAGPALVWGIVLSGIAQFILVAWWAARLGFSLRLRRPRLTPDMRRFFALLGPGIVAGGATQINLLIGGLIASFQDGARAWLYYADRLYQLPLGLIGVAIGIVLLPDVARKLRAGEEGLALRLQNRALETAMLLTVPAAVALAVAADPIVRTLYERGRFTGADADPVAWALMIYAAGLPAFVAIKVFQPGFFARQDTRTPLRFSLWSVAVNIVLGLALFPLFGHLGIAAATVVAGWANALLLWRRLAVLGHWQSDEALRLRLPRIALASGLMALVLLAAIAGLAGMVDAGGAARWTATGLLVLAGVAAFAVFAVMTRATDVADLRAAFRRRKQ